ncbi:MAG: Urease accessory protein UreD [Proteobacteria bacterium]|nr:Urease accessory protein UreD [Pseudomonadota bacterium]
MNAVAETPLLSAHSHQHGWQASLALRVENRNGRSVLAQNLHKGPLRVQKALYPEGDAVCQILMLHPPAGIAGGDQLRIDLDVGAGAHAQLTTPGAGKWYRSGPPACSAKQPPEEAKKVSGRPNDFLERLGPLATQDISLNIAPGGMLEWLPQEVIVFDQAHAQSTTTITLAEGARAIGWDIICLGRSASGESFDRGAFRQRLRLQRPDANPLWCETLHLTGSDAALQSGLALNGNTVFGTLWLAGIAPDTALLEALRGESIHGGTCGISALPDVTIVRVLSNSAEAARQYFEAVWALARPHVLQRVAIKPRIWST